MGIRSIRRRRALAAGLGGVAAMGLVGASAATLGGLTAGDLGADFSVVASCDSDGISANWDPSYDSSFPDYAIGDVDLSGVDASCAGQNLKVELTGAADAGLGEEVTTVSGTSQTVTFSTAVDASLVTGIAVTIYE